ncbi:MAG: 1,2-phenylacetyl-CoA epoxidase subunit PaaC [Bacteroidia bacterium]
MKPLVSLLYALADDELILGHRHSEWIGVGPILEEDIAFASIAQDEVGHAQAYYLLLEQLGEGQVDPIAFNRGASENYRCCQLVELPHFDFDYAIALVRHYLYDMADKVRLEFLAQSRYEPLALLAQKLMREEKYHQLHARTWMQKLAQATPESHLRIQKALHDLLPMAYSIFEPLPQEEALVAEGFLPAPHTTLQAAWEKLIYPELNQWGLQVDYPTPEGLGGRQGIHSAHLEPLLAEMTAVFSLDPRAEW